jgi:phage gp29-like protein
VNGSGPPADHPLHGGVVLGSADQTRQIIERDVGGGTPPTKDDPGNQPPRDEALTGNIKARVQIAYRQIPNVIIQDHWKPPQIRQALSAHMMGLFDGSTQMWDAICGDDRIQPTVDARVDGLLGAEPMVMPSQIERVKGSRAAKEVADMWSDNLTRIQSEAATSERQRYVIGMGFANGTLNWDRSKPIWIPVYTPFNSRWMFWHWTLNVMVAITLDGAYAVFPGDGNWVLHAPHGELRGWIRGAIRAAAQPWAIRNYAYRDWARFSEVHGNPWLVGKVPAAADPVARDAFRAQLQNVGEGAVLVLPQGVDTSALGYDVEFKEAGDSAGEDAFSGLIDRCDRSIILVIQGQNLTTEVDEGSLAAARVHAAVKQTKLQSDERSEALTLYTQVARPFAEVNYGDADLAPMTRRDIEPVEDYRDRAGLLQSIGTAMQALRNGGIEFEDENEVRRFIIRTFGLPRFPKMKFSIPTTSTISETKETPVSVSIARTK